MDIVLLCTANICRSPMAGGLLRRRLEDLGVDATVATAGRMEDGHEASEHGVTVMAEVGIDLRPHRSRVSAPEVLRDADLIVGMAREHVRDAVAMEPSVWPRSFTLKELVRRGEDLGPRAPGQPVAEWLAKLHAGRQARDLLEHSDPADDVADPIGQPLHEYQRTADELSGLVDRMVALLWGSVHQ